MEEDVSSFIIYLRHHSNEKLIPIINFIQHQQALPKKTKKIFVVIVS